MWSIKMVKGQPCHLSSFLSIWCRRAALGGVLPGQGAGVCSVACILLEHSCPHCPLLHHADVTRLCPTWSCGRLRPQSPFPFGGVPVLQSDFRSQKAAPDGQRVPSNLLIWETRGRLGRERQAQGQESALWGETGPVSGCRCLPLAVPTCLCLVWRCLHHPC